MPEIAHDLADLAHDGEGVGIALDDLGQQGYLIVVHHAHDDVHFPAVVHALGGEDGGRVVELLDDLLADLLRVVGDDLKPHGAAAVFQEPLRHIGGGEAVEDAQKHRLHLVIIYKVAGNGYRGVHEKGQAHDAFFRVFGVDDGRQKVRASGIGAGLHEDGVDITHDDTGGQRPHDPAGAVGGGVGNGGEVHLVQDQQPQGKHHHIDHAPHGHGLADLKIDDQSQRHIDQQTHIANADAGYVLDHGTDAVEARWGKGIGEDKQLIVQRRRQGHQRNDKIGPNHPESTHFPVLFSLPYFLPEGRGYFSG